MPPRKKTAARVRPNLRAYVEKRDFTVTSEPAPSSESETEPPSRRRRPPTFMVHKHDATRMHYDLRLEMDGALASWAVPKGPSFNPKERRLAVQTEDHPLSYASFEGRIPEGEYGAGDSIVWDRGIYDTVPPGEASAMRKKGHLEFVLTGEKLKGRWHLVRTRSQGGKAQWLLFKGKDEHASESYDVVAERPESVISGRKITRGPTPVAVRRSTGDPISVLMRVWPPARRPPGGRRTTGTAAGQRAITGISGGRVALQSPEGRDLAAANPRLVKQLARLDVVDAAIEGEILPGKTPRFRLRDLLWLDGEDVRSRPAAERRELLASRVPAAAEGVELPSGGAATRPRRKASRS